MRIKTSDPVDGRVMLTIVAEAHEVDDGIAYSISKCAGENGIDWRESRDIEFDLRAKVGGDFLTAYLNTQVPLFLAAKAIGQSKLATLLNPEVSGSLPRIEKGKPVEFSVSVLLKPQFELSSYAPVKIEVPEIDVTEEEVSTQLYMLAESFATYASGEDGELDTSQRIIPAITDKWVEENLPDITTVAELREMLYQNGIQYKRAEQREYTNYAASTELAKRLEGTISNEIFELSRNDLLSALKRNLDSQGRTLEEFVQSQGGEQAFYAKLLLQTNTVLKQGFALDALARHLDMRLTAADIDAAFSNMAPGYEDVARAEFERTGRMYVIEEAALRIKANRYLVDKAIVTYVDKSKLTDSSEEFDVGHDHDHNHDHDHDHEHEHGHGHGHGDHDHEHGHSHGHGDHDHDHEHEHDLKAVHDDDRNDHDPTVGENQEDR